MKKVLIIALILGFVGVGNAVADEFVTGDLDVVDMRIYEAQPCFTEGCGTNIRTCEVRFEFLTDNGQPYFLFGEAFGDALNLALWQVHVDDIEVRALLRYVITPLDIDIVWISLAEDNG